MSNPDINGWSVVAALGGCIHLALSMERRVRRHKTDLARCTVEQKQSQRHRRYLRRLPWAGLVLAFFPRLGLDFAAIARFDVLLPVSFFAFGATGFDFASAASRLVLGIAAFRPMPARFRSAKYSFIGTK